MIKPLIFVLFAGTAWAEGERAGEFDYYLLSLSWTPSFCEIEGDGKGYEICETTGNGFTVHGLWPQFEEGWPSYCRTVERDPTRGETAAMADVLGSSGSAWYQWQKHGRCSGLPANTYFQTVREAFARFARPELLRRLDKEIIIDPWVVEAAIIEDNPWLSPDQITITCKSGYVQEARICLTRELEPRRCGADVIRDCTVPSLLPPVR